jgi:hypothetical protein
VTTSHATTATLTLTSPAYYTLNKLTVTAPAGYNVTGATGTVTGLGSGTWTTAVSGQDITLSTTSPIRSAPGAAVSVSLSGLVTASTGGTKTWKVNGYQFGQPAARLLTTGGTVSLLAPTVAVTLGANTAALTANPQNADPTKDVTVSVAGNAPYGVTLSASATAPTAGLPWVSANVTTGYATASLPTTSWLAASWLSPVGWNAALGSALEAGKWTGLPTAAGTTAQKSFASSTVMNTGTPLTGTLRFRAHAGWGLAPGSYTSTVTVTATAN